MINKKLLPSGLRIVTIPQKNTNAVTFLVLVGTGSKFETKDVSGISHFLEHMFFKGTQKRPNTIDIAETLDRVGGEYNAFTSKEVTGYWAKVDSKHQDVALDWISDIFLNSKLDATELEREKGVIIEEMNMYLDTPTSYIGDLWDNVLYGDQPAGWKVIGEKENIIKMNRDKIVDYFKTHYSAKNTIVCVAGNISGKATQEKIKEAFEKVNDIEPRKKVAIKEVQTKPESLVYFKETDQTHLCLGVRGYNIFHPDRYALGLLATILGGNMSSRLFISVRERQGLAYYIKTFSDVGSDAGSFLTQAGIDHKNIEKVIGLVLSEYQALKDNLISEDELQKAKDYTKGNMSLSLESSDSQAFFHAEQELIKNEILSLDQIFEKIDQVTVNDIKRVAGDIFKKDKLNLAVIGPFKDKEQFDKLLELK